MVNNEHDSRNSKITETETGSIDEGNLVKEVYVLLGVTACVLATELLTESYSEFIRLQSKAVYVFFLILAGRIVLFPLWYTYYERTVNYALGKQRSILPLASLLNVVLDVSVILLMLFWVEVDKVHVVSVPVVPIVYIVLAAVQLILVLGSDYWSAMRQ